MPWPSERSALWPGKSSLRFNTNPHRQGVLDHLEELRRRLLICLAALVIFSGAGWFFSKILLEFLMCPLADLQETELYFHAPYDAFLVHFKTALLAGALFSSPVFFSELWLFLAPGLHREERKIVFPLILLSIFLFAAGAAFALWVLVPAGLRILLAFQTETLKPLLEAGPYFSFLTGMMLATGIVFILPVLLLGLVRLRVLGAAALRSARRGVAILILILAAVLTPSPDPVGQILLALPLYLLYEVSVWAAGWLEKKNKK